MSSTFDKKYVYQVARIRAHELSLFDKQNLTTFSSAKDIKELISLLKEKNWGDENDKTVSDILVSERKKLWSLVDELIDDKSIFDVFRLKNDYNNIKAAIKEAVSNEKYEHIYIDETTLDMDKIKAAIREKDYQTLSDELVEVVRDAHEELLKYGDAQKSDLIIDRACLDAIMAAKEKTDDEFLKMYAELTVATSNIKIAYRGLKTGKDRTFYDKAIAECETISKDALIDAAVRGEDALFAYLQGTNYGEAANILKESSLKFEKWCTNIVVERMKNELYNSFGIGPIAAYILARENEIKNVKIIAASIENGLPMENIDERLVETYV